jgi:hypothetical protein
VHPDPAAPAITVDADSSRDGINPGQHRLTRPVSVANPVNPQPRLLQQIIGLLQVFRSASKVPKQRRTESFHQDSRSFGIGTLVSFHPTTKFIPDCIH